MVLRAGVPVADVEFMQFHPTALFSPRMPRPLLSEALRGHGALIRDRYGDRFVDELRPRDVVARAITAKLIEHDTDHLWLDATGLEHFDERFPTIAADLHAAGLDPARDWLPIAPAAHYHCGGVLTDLHGATALPGLWAAGEVANVGVHGANRLASNSLLEGMVYGPRVIEAIGQGADRAEPSGAMRATLGPGPLDDSDVIGGRRITRPRPTSEPPAVGDVAMLRSLLQRTMTRCAGVLRSAASLDEARRAVDAVGAQAVNEPPAPARTELLNLVEVARAVLAGASAREESRGCHTREDHPATLDAFRVRLVQ
jgi:L-aspartate oxidase